MKITLNQLESHLAASLASVYILTGDEILLVDEALDRIITQANAKGFTEIQRFYSTEPDMWERLAMAASLGSLFAEKTLLLCRLSSPKLNEKAHTVLRRYSERLPEDKLLVLSMGKLSGSEPKQSGLSALEKAGVMITLWPVALSQFPIWLKKRLETAGFIIKDESVLALLCTYLEGNLLAAAQCVEKCKLIYPKETVLTETHVMQCLAPDARYTVFDLTKAIAEKKIRKIAPILWVLREENTEPAIVLWALARECRKSQQVALFARLAFIDSLIKGIRSGSIWQALERLCFCMTGRPLFEFEKEELT